MNEYRSFFAPSVSKPISDDLSIFSRYNLDGAELSTRWLMLKQDVREGLTKHFETMNNNELLNDDMALFLMNPQHYTPWFVSLFCCLKRLNISYDATFLALLTQQSCNARSLEHIICRFSELKLEINSARLIQLVLMRNLDDFLFNRLLSTLESTPPLTIEHVYTLLQYPNLSLDNYNDCVILLDRAHLLTLINEKHLLTLLNDELSAVTKCLHLLDKHEEAISQKLLTVLFKHHETAHQIAEGLKHLDSRSIQFAFKVTSERALIVVGAKEWAEPTANALSFLILGKADTRENNAKLLKMKQEIKVVPGLLNQLLCNRNLLPDNIACILRVAHLFNDPRLLKAYHTILGLEPLTQSCIKSLLSTLRKWSAQMNIQDQEELIVDCVLLIDPTADDVRVAPPSDDDCMRLACP